MYFSLNYYCCIIYVQIFKFKKETEVKRKNTSFMWTLCYLQDNLFIFSLLLIKKTTDKFPRPCEVDLLFLASDWSELPSDANCSFVPYIWSLHWCTCIDSWLELEQHFPCRPDLRAALRVVWGGWSSITVKAFVFCKMFLFFLLFVNSLLFVWRDVSKQTFSFEVNTEVLVLSICKHSIEFCGVSKLQSVFS